MASFLKFIFILALGIALLGANLAFAGDAASDPKATDKPETAKADGAAAPTTYKVIIDGMSWGMWVKAAKTALTSLDGVDSVVVTLKDKTAVIVTKPGKTLTKEVVETAVKNSKDGLSVTSFEQVKEEAKKEPTKEKPEAAQPPPKGWTTGIGWGGPNQL